MKPEEYKLIALTLNRESEKYGVEIVEDPEDMTIINTVCVFSPQQAKQVSLELFSAVNRIGGVS